MKQDMYIKLIELIDKTSYLDKMTIFYKDGSMKRINIKEITNIQPGYIELTRWYPGQEYEEIISLENVQSYRIQVYPDNAHARLKVEV